jgi:hypothetical protein
MKRRLEKELLRRELAKREVLPFCQLIHGPDYKAGWVHGDLCALLDAFVDGVEQGKRPRLMVWVPPRHGKSHIISRAFPAFLLGKHPEWEVVNATYGQDLANDMGRFVRGVLNDNVFNSIFPTTIVDPASNAMDRVDTYALGKRNRGGYKAVGVGGALTGRGAHVLIIDDPVKNREDADSELMREQTWNWYSSTARTRLAPGGGVIILQTRWHLEDLSGRLIERAKADKKADQWHVYKFPAIATADEYGLDGKLRRKAGEALDPARFPIEELEQLRATIMPRDWNALYQQNPVAEDGTYFLRDWIKLWEEG